MIFISGIHGVGKSYFCEKVNKSLGIKTYSASELISELKNEMFEKNKLISDIDNNQGYLLAAVKKLNESEKFFLLDGHFCLLNAQGEGQRIRVDTFIELNPEGILLLTEEPVVIAKRRKNRDGIKYDIEQINSFQKEEVAYAGEVSRLMGVPLYISKGSSAIEDAIKFIGAFIQKLNI